MNKLSLKMVCALLISGMLGSAIFSLSGLTILYAGPSAFISYLFAAVIQFFYGLVLAELATTYKESGGGFIFPEKTFEGKIGKTIGFINTWGLIFSDVISISFTSYCVSAYLSLVFPNLINYSLIVNLIALLVCLLINYMNIVGTSKINNILGVALIIVLLFYCVSIIHTGSFNINNLTPFFNDTNIKGMNIIKALPIAIVGYSTLGTISFLAGEIENQKRNIPLAIIISLSVVAFIYAAVVFLTTSVITSKDLIDNNMVMAPIMCAVTLKLSKVPLLKELISIAAVFALLTTSIVVIAVNGRNLKAAAENGMLPKIFSKTSKSNSPVYAMTIITILSAIPLFFGNFIETVVNEAAIIIVVSIIINFICLYFTRKKMIKKEDKFTAPFSTFTLAILIIILIAINIPNLVSGGLKLVLITVSWYIVGIFVYKIMGKINDK